MGDTISENLKIKSRPDYPEEDQVCGCETDLDSTVIETQLQFRLFPFTCIRGELFYELNTDYMTNQIDCFFEVE